MSDILGFHFVEHRSKSLLVHVLLDSLETSDVAVEGAVEVGEQYPMYMENQICAVVPQEGFYVVYSASQRLSDVVAAISRVIDIKASR